MLEFLTGLRANGVIDGKWMGKTVIFGNTVHLVFHVATSADGTAATFDCLETKFFGVPVSETVHDKNSVRFDLGFGTVFLGELDSEMTAINGLLDLGGYKSPVTLARAA
jgi:hypothetical protein